MPHDFNNRPINVGDKVTVEMRVTDIAVGEDYCNLTLETVEPMFPADNKSCLTLNGRQVKLKGPAHG